MQVRTRCCSEGVLSLIRDDFGKAGSLPRSVAGLLSLDVVWMLVLYRFAHALYRTPLRPVSWMLKSVVQVLYGCDIHPGACLGRRPSFAHTVGVVVGGGVRVRSDIKIFANVTLGADDQNGSARLGSRVTVYTGACVFGDIEVGDDARIAANAVVSDDVPAGSLAAGVPAKILLRRTDGAS